MAFNNSQENLNNSLSAKDAASQQFQTVSVSSESVSGDVEKARR